MEGETKCPWCKEHMVPKLEILAHRVARVTERRCSRCGKIVAAYLTDEEFLDGIRNRVISFRE